MMQQYIENMDQEVRCDHPVSADTKQLWNIQMDMSLRLIDVCKRYGLKIWAISGTMLGAVRHHGFIPWDDDIDFVMFREDYDRLAQIAPQEFKSPYFFQTFYTESGYYRGHAQLRYDNTAMISRLEAELGYDFNQGVFIDIFVLDGVPEDKAELNSLINLVKSVQNLLCDRHYPRQFVMFMSPGNIIRYVKTLKHRIFWSDRRLCEYMEKALRQNKVSDCQMVGALMFDYVPRCIRQRQWFDETVWLPFEKIEMPVPSRYDEMLSYEYGDYMKFVKGTSMHGNNMVYDIHRSYKGLLPELRLTWTQVFKRFVGRFSKKSK